ncbi:ion transporter [Mesonia sp. HuA40]|uniref:ion transporter n=1 Tax=Mesonia sp. HuA40 TaxID=2602761 RepID=UPI0011CBEAA5|nr:ion transporter [Mesonia sp. HuA40]TXK74324.1 ion transporter [Mesonia sp. HuA40]
MKKNKHTDITWREKLHDIIYEAETPAGKAFDVVLLIFIFLSVIFVMLESVPGLEPWVYEYLIYAEWIITILFTIEYILRIISIRRPSRYIFSFYGIIDFLSTIPLYLSFFITGSSALITFRALRLLRVFRVLKISRYMGEGNRLLGALRNSRAKIFVFLFAVVVLSIIAGTLMYMIEGEKAGFTSIPVGVYWTIVTLTTVGFGDIHPITSMGRFLASLIMILGYGIIAVPTGIVSAEYSARSRNDESFNSLSCYNCNEKTHLDRAKYCHSCGYSLRNEIRKNNE